MTEICDWNDATLTLVRGRGDVIEAVALASAAVGWLHQRRYAEAIDAFEHVRELSPLDPDVVARAAWAAGVSSMNLPDPVGAERIWRAGLEAHPSPWHEAFLRASLTLVTRRDNTVAVDLIERVASPTVTAWYRIWSARILGPPERLAPTEASLSQVVDETNRIGAPHPLGVALYTLAFVQAQLPARSTDDVLGLLDRGITLWTRLRTPFQLLAALEVLALTLALRGAPEPARTIFAAVDARGGFANFRQLRALVAENLASIPPAAIDACQQRAAGFTTIDHAAEFALQTISKLRGEATNGHATPGP